MEVTCRTVQGRFLLRPTAGLREIFVGILARAAERYDVAVHAFVCLSNHYHMLVSPADACELARFMCYFNTNLSKEAGRLHRWRGSLLQGRYQAILVSNEEVAQVARLRYLLAHGCKEGLVARLREWPGAHCGRSLSTGEPSPGVWFDRRRQWFSMVRGEGHPPEAFVTHYKLTLDPLPCWRHLPAQTIRAQVSAMIAAIEEEVAESCRTEGRRPMGPAAILSQHPHQHPAQISHSPAILVHAASRTVRLELRAAYALFVGAFRAAAERLREGCHDLVFPDGCFPPPLPFRGG